MRLRLRITTISLLLPRHEVGLGIGIFLAGSAAADAYGRVLALRIMPYDFENYALEIIIYSWEDTNLFVGYCLVLFA